jgi:hypothetical protein
MQKKNKNRSVKRSNQRSPLLVEDSIDPPKWFDCEPIHRVVRLASISAATEFDVTMLMIARLQSMYATAATAFPLASAIRMKYVKLWGVAQTNQTTASVAVEWNAGSTGFLLNSTSVSDTTVSIDRPAYIKATPPKQSLASWYQSYLTGFTNVLFTITVPAGCLIEIAYDWVLNSTEAALAVFVPAAAGSAGLVFAQVWSANFVVLTPLNQG